MPIPPQPKISDEVWSNTYYFTATATDTDKIESDYCNEVSTTLYQTNGLTHYAVALAWDPSPGTNQIVDYKIYWGPSSRTYTNSAHAGTNLSLTVRVIPAPMTNLVITVTVLNGGTNIGCSRSPGGPWTLLGTTNYSVTNPITPAYFRGLGKGGNRVTISSKTI